IDTSVENFASGAWQALGNAWKGGSSFVQKRKAKLSTEEKSAYDVKLKEVQQMLILENGNNIENAPNNVDDEIIKSFHKSTLQMPLQNYLHVILLIKTHGRLDPIYSEGIHRLSEMCCIALSQLLILGKSVTHNENKAQDPADDMDIVKIEWPKDFMEKAKTMRMLLLINDCIPGGSCSQFYGWYL
ncbi:uncharacterized protein LOC143589118, partial [Bidens hawaiensis]|uniref:uncharacterized protein LOC143589118 n=1 Tax=Bidens hawaiensis TaxID=980011 RepID=UPI00404B44C2